VKAVRLLVWAAGAALCATMITGAIRGPWPPADKAAIAYSAVFIGITIGVIVWQLRPETRTGLLLTAFPLTSLLADLRIVFPGSALAVTIGYACVWLPAPVFGHLVLSYPSGRLRSLPDRVLVGAAYVVATVYGLVAVVLYDPRPQFDGTILQFDYHALPLLHVGGYDATRLLDGLEASLAVLAVFLLVLLVRKLVRASAGGRRVVLPLAVAAAFVAVQFLVQFFVFGEPVNSWTHDDWFWIVTFASVGIPLSLAAGLLWGRRARALVADLVVELERAAPPGAIRDALARTLGDPSLELALWLPDRHGYVDGAGRPVVLPAAGSDRAITVLGPPESPVAALVHDPVLLERRALLAAAGAAARLALENERLQAQLRAQVAELRASRARIVNAGDEERRRLERDLHDGAQQRLLSLGLVLQLARAKLGPDANGAGELLAEADAELRGALDELRELAHGIHPATLTEQGLGAAIRSLAERSPVQVVIAGMPRERLAPSAEAAAYFLVSEALANVSKHAHASRVRINVAHTDGRIDVAVDDDGVGGADPSRGSGLRGLADRVHALDGRLELESRPGGGTHLHAVIPCA
jgi:signal transduction histidine kinase